MNEIAQTLEAVALGLTVGVAGGGLIINFAAFAGRKNWEEDAKKYSQQELLEKIEENESKLKENNKFTYYVSFPARKIAYKSLLKKTA